VVAERRGKVGIVRLNRPKQLNALSDALVRDIQSALLYFQDDTSVGAMILTGSEKAFAAGADIKEMSTKTYMDTYKSNMLAQWQDVTKIKKPIIAAVAGFALGGGCELAMLCDMIIAADNAMFGQPEVQLGTIPGTYSLLVLITMIPTPQLYISHLHHYSLISVFKLHSFIFHFRVWWHTETNKSCWKIEGNGINPHRQPDECQRC
jgi:enoyl-CoA hydratase/carnithine racemase